MNFNQLVHHTYHNTSQNAIEVGWCHVPEYCVGDPNAQFVTHNHDTGHFYFHDGWKVIFDNSTILARVATENDAVQFVGLFDDADTGRYTIDGISEE